MQKISVIFKIEFKLYYIPSKFVLAKRPLRFLHAFFGFFMLHKRFAN
jgi:hypothetical protein